ncbi:MAG: MoaD/ThiS family protein [Pyrinomonadaceae bacterium]
MSVKVLFFGATASVTGKRQIEVAVEGTTRASKIFDDVLSQYPALTSHRLLFSLNQTYADGSERISDGDELAIFTAVSGG